MKFTGNKTLSQDEKIIIESHFQAFYGNAYFASPHRTAFIDSLLEQYDNSGFLTEKQINALANAVEDLTDLTTGISY